MLDSNIKAQLKAYMEKLVDPIELVASLNESNESQQMKAMIEDIASVSDKISFRHNGNDTRRPSFSVARIGDTHRIRFAGIPMGHEFTSLVLALLQASGYAPKIEEDVVEQIKNILDLYETNFIYQIEKILNKQFEEVE